MSQAVTSLCGAVAGRGHQLFTTHPGCMLTSEALYMCVWGGGGGGGAGRQAIFR